MMTIAMDFGMHTFSGTAAETVLGRFFEAAVVPELWPKAFERLAEACGAEGAAVNAIDGLRTHGTVGSEALLELYHGFVTRWRAPELNSHRARGLALIRRGWRGVLTEQIASHPKSSRAIRFTRNISCVPASRHLPARFSRKGRA